MAIWKFSIPPIHTLGYKWATPVTPPHVQVNNNIDRDWQSYIDQQGINIVSINILMAISLNRLWVNLHQMTATHGHLLAPLV
jgi:hypothetical protein